MNEMIYSSLMECILRWIRRILGKEKSKRGEKKRRKISKKKNNLWWSRCLQSYFLLQIQDRVSRKSEICMHLRKMRFIVYVLCEFLRLQKVQMHLHWERLCAWCQAMILPFSFLQSCWLPASLFFVIYVLNHITN